MKLLSIVSLFVFGASSIFAAPVDLSWQDNSNNEQGFRIERALGVSAFVQINNVAANVTAYSDIDILLPGTVYSYRVRSYNPAGNSVYSNIATITTPSASNANPTISDITDKTININSNTGAITFVVGDAETAAASLTISGASSNLVLVPVANIVFSGSGASRTVTITPVAGQIGTATITITVSDGVKTASDIFVLSVVQTVPNPPTGLTIIP